MTYDWGSKGNQIQFDFNIDIINKATESLISHEAGNFESAASFVSSLIGDLSYRNKLIKIADQSEYGWDAATEYERNTAASNDEDDRKIKKADVAALAKRKRKQEKSVKKGGKVAKDTTKPDAPVAQQAVLPGPAHYFPPPWAYFSQPGQGLPAAQTAAAPAPAPATTSMVQGPCFYCKGPHMRVNCPILLAKKAALQESSTE